MGILCLRILGVSNGRMATENPDARKSLRSEAVHSAWDKHRASRKLVFVGGGEKGYQNGDEAALGFRSAPLGLCTVPGSSDADRIESKRSTSIPAMGILCLRILGVSNGRMATENPDARQSLRSEAVHSAWDKHRASRKLAFA